MSELVKNVKGPSEWYCENGKNCWYNEYSTLVSVFPDNIQLACDVGECANEQDFLDVGPIEQKFSSYTEVMIISAIFVACVLLYGVTKYTALKQRKIFGTRIQLTEDNNDDLSSYSSTAEVTLTFSEVSYTVNGKHILSNLSGYVEPGQMLAVMGPSGAGKSSLLDILARKHKRGVASGNILLNGVSPSVRQFRRLTGFVDQDDSLMGTLTVRETLTYAAMMRLPRQMPLQAKLKRVEEVIQELGISKIADSQIGMPGKRGISGGEKRRVSIGKELVTSPSLLFLDEPTSGLDAYNAGVVMECLHRLAHEGKRTIVVTIHQPRSNIYQMFDSLMLLSTGQMVLLFHLYLFSNCASNNCSVDLTMKRPDDLTSMHPDAPYNSSHINSSSRDQEELDLLSESNHTHYLFDSFVSSELYKTVEKRIGRSLNFIMNGYFCLQELSSICSLFWQVDVDLSGVQNRLGVLFFMCALLGFAATSSLDIFSNERILFMRERENGYYSPSAYFLAKIMFDIVPLRVIPPLVMGSICYYMIGLNPSLVIFAKFLLVLVLFNLAAAGLCMCFAIGIKSLSMANLIANLTILFSMLFGGFLLNKDHIPPVLSWLQHLSFFNYGYEALIVNELKDITLRDKSIADIQIPGPIILARFGFNGQAFWSDVTRLMIFVCFTLSCSFIFLKYLVKEKR
ncbi:hypothetical protein RO3G_07403 [Rhizopus delemar RA 99-880]|uniref:ABC transporter domain-containing protein n=1 Tax=Rhizopus delemar (strain RA 99-880 / ATCC MYA-4621 / FGSC 9543 / NRRL 43880) TaxID=246409 RepID=I1C2L8_RHIO9|nr:hypothetical protein RO3G_07403 [Rhizopus delemar RA 99-880]|eukprot:EIE82698.1 hypothetical protein RO3G_07403 [Rhizopus delemar RA 99-880]